MNSINNKNNFAVQLENSKSTGSLAEVETLYEKVFQEAYAIGYRDGRMSLSKFNISEQKQEQERHYIQSKDAMVAYNSHVTSLIQDLINFYERGTPINETMMNRSESLKSAAYEQATQITNVMTKNIHDKTNVVNALIKSSLSNTNEAFGKDMYFNRFVGTVLVAAKKINKKIQPLILDQENQRENLQNAQKLSIEVLAHVNQAHKNMESERNTLNAYMKFTNGQ